MHRGFAQQDHTSVTKPPIKTCVFIWPPLAKRRRTSRTQHTCHIDIVFQRKHQTIKGAERLPPAPAFCTGLGLTHRRIATHMNESMEQWRSLLNLRKVGFGNSNRRDLTALVGRP
jgi:hypothetical protein